MEGLKGIKNMESYTVKPPKIVALIKICGAIQYTVTENHNFIKPTPEQIKNLHNLLNIDVELVEDDEEKDGTKYTVEETS